MSKPSIKDAVRGSLPKQVIVEVTINILSFSLLIIAQQIWALPIISRFYDISQFGEIVLAFGISNIITSMFGFSIGNARLLEQKFYNTFYLKMIQKSSIFVIFASFILYKYTFSGSNMNSSIYALVCGLGSIRYFLLSEYRIKDNHNRIFKQNLGYFVGIIIGTIHFYFYKNWLIVFLLAEVISISYSYAHLQREGFLKLFKDNSQIKLTNTIQLIINNGVSYSLLYYDRFVIYPLLGAANVSLYYSASVSSKLGALVLNPLSNYILGKLANKKESSNAKEINLIILASVFLVIIYFLLSVITTPILVFILYPDFLSEIKAFFIPICLGAAIMGGVSIIKPVVMKFIGVKYYNSLYMVYGIILISLSIVLCNQYGLIGVAFAQIISSVILYIWLSISLKKLNNKIV